ncbi:isoleucine--tRNA ligase [Texas Phoenix palm phytoplasma]|uniref:Isoleucine--tRNA ligase n=1 Tax=Texas Phoenix palm phytoplasma TaxID=176709 RepID=A0ABS5BI38_9MOLU|nr:isoleucine--tRNA ligase [Texas Phoenix palm phytoplasma]MBP3059242.1 isoleucine--tRNA ligase [Texas Phoenix palm phytoplasma]
MNKNYKDTLLMPYTDFPMKGNLSQKEIEIEKYWEDINLYQNILEKNKNNKQFILHDGPPYANGNIHIGHALNKILKDFILRFKSMQGFYTPFIPGFDLHGLPTETAVLKKFSKDKFSSKKIFLQTCKNLSLNFVEKQKKSFKRLGILGNWDNPYLTTDNDFIAEQIRIFGKMVEKKLIFKKLKPVYWSTSLQSVFADSEIEYKEHNSFSVFLTFPIIREKLNILKDAKLLVWTTTPWTLPANVAICVHPDNNYILVKNNNEKYIIGEINLNFLKQKFNWNKIEIIEKFKGEQLKNINYRNNIFLREGKIITDKFVSKNEGTGLVHIAPGHGTDDFLLAEKYNLEVLCSIDQKGLMTEISGNYKGIFYKEANEIIVKDLIKKNTIIKSEFIKHSYPHDERTKNPVILLAIPQWFLNINKIKNKILEEIEKINWIPKWGQIKMHNMIKNRDYWVISRQRSWGVPLPIIITENNEPILDLKVINHIADLFEKKGPEIWFEWDAIDLLPKNYKNPKSPNNIFKKEKDIMDVWFDSGTSYSVIQKLSKNFFPSDIYLEGSDQYRGWFNSSLITSVATFNKSPYKEIITHGFVLDGDGQKMSKSLNNIIDPIDIIKNKGADILRLWVANVNYNADVKINAEIIKQIEDKYRKIRNTLRFMLGNLNDFDNKKDYIIFEKRKTIHQFFLLEFKNILLKIIKYYENYNFEKIINLIYPFLTNKLSAFYLNFAKNILYIENKNNINRRIIQSNIYDILIDLLKILTPIIPHTTSEAYNSFKLKNKKDIYLESIPNSKEIENFIITKEKENKLIQKKEYYDLLFELREIILKKLEKACKEKIITQTLKTKIILNLPQKYINMLEELEIQNIFNKLINVSQIEILFNDKLNIEINSASGTACPRCWFLIENKSKEKDLCFNCYSILKMNK